MWNLECGKWNEPQQQLGSSCRVIPASEPESICCCRLANLKVMWIPVFTGMTTKNIREKNEKQIFIKNIQKHN